MLLAGANVELALGKKKPTGRDSSESSPASRLQRAAIVVAC
jgi:hypothetical protein